MRTFALIVGLLCAPVFVQADDFYRNEVCFGLGWANTFEKNIFNVTDDQDITNVLALNLVGRYHFSPSFALGVNLYGYFKKTGDFTLVDAGGGTTTTKFDFNAGNIGAQAQYTFATGSVRPYTYVALNWATGFIQSDTDFPGRLDYNGLSAGLGGGLGFMLAQQIMLSAEALVSFGVAAWDTEPFGNSSSDDFDPSQYGFLVNVSYFWGSTGSGQSAVEGTSDDSRD